MHACRYMVWLLLLRPSSHERSAPLAKLAPMFWGAQPGIGDLQLTRWCSVQDRGVATYTHDLVEVTDYTRVDADSDPQRLAGHTSVLRGHGQ